MYYLKVFIVVLQKLRCLLLSVFIKKHVYTMVYLNWLLYHVHLCPNSNGSPWKNGFSECMQVMLANPHDPYIQRGYRPFEINTCSSISSREYNTEGKLNWALDIRFKHTNTQLHYTYVLRDKEDCLLQTHHSPYRKDIIQYVNKTVCYVCCILDYGPISASI